MISLIKTDLKRIFKDKLFLVVCIIGAVFAVMSPLLFQLILVALEVEEVGPFIVNSKTLFFNSFSLGNNFGLILPVLVSIILCKDFSYGTVRNKIICGKSRSAIFLSMFISGTVVMCLIITAHALLSLFVSLLFFEYPLSENIAADIGYALLSFLLEMAVYAFIGALISFLCVSMKNVGLTIVCYVAIAIVCAIVGSVITVAFQLADPADKAAYAVLEFFNDSNVFTSLTIGSGTEYTLKQLLHILLPTLGGGVLLVLGGALVFNKKDIK